MAAQQYTEQNPPGWRLRWARALYRAYYRIKYLPFAAERRNRQEFPRRGFVGIQIDALAHEDFERALARGYLPRMKRLLEREGWQIRRYPAGLPSATPAAQASIFYGTKGDIPAFRFYDKARRRVVIGSQPSSMQFIRDSLPDSGVLEGGSSYVNLYDGGADTAVFTLSARRRTPLFQKMGGGRLLLLLLLHPIRTLRMVAASAIEYLREERDRLLSQIKGQATHYWWYLPLLHIGTNVILRELQTLAVLLDIYTGKRAIYTTYNVYDEFAHHFGPSSRTALKCLKALDRRVDEILRMTRRLPGRPYDVYILSDHGQTPSVPYRVRYGETLGDTILDAVRHGVFVIAGTGEFGDPRETLDLLVQEVEAVASTSSRPTRSAALGLSRWFRKHYSIFPLMAEVVRVDEAQKLVVTYSSSLAHLYWTGPRHPLRLDDIRLNPDRRALYYFLVTHEAIGFVATRVVDGVHIESPRGRALLTPRGDFELLEGEDPLKDYASTAVEYRAIARLAQLRNAGDVVMVGAYHPDEDLCICFDDQVGAHGGIGGRQFWPFILTAPGIIPEGYQIDDPLDLYGLLNRYRTDPEENL
ncbi:MAG TPA: alkaline phosphatase family protein [Longimicrobiales bacterium]|nr:alkaline phosphatase family protein [Longimicrobiales bacterium]